MNRIIIYIQYLSKFQYNCTYLYSIIIQMDPRLYSYQYRRMRPNNPTYSSYNVNTSLTYFMQPNSNSPRKTTTYQQQQFYNHGNNQQQQQQQQQQLYSYPRKQQSQSNNGNEDRYRQRNRSHLSNYGTSSLAFTERDIYNKQNSKFNIISLKPKQVNDQIKVYPKYSLENKDDVYYRKMQKVRDEEIRNQTMRSSSLGRSMNWKPEDVAGKHTFQPDESKNPNYYQHGRYFTPGMLNHADQVSNIM